MPSGNLPTWLRLIRRIVRRENANLRVATVAVVESYDDDTRSCVVKPVLPVRRPNGQVVSLPEIYAVPVKTMRFGGFVIAAPLDPGDFVELTFADRSLERWLTEGGTNALDPEDVRMHHLSDAMAGPGPDPNTDAAFSTGGNLVIGRETGGVQIVITPDGKVSIGTVTTDLVALLSDLAGAVATGVVPSGGGPLSTAGVGLTVQTAANTIKR